MKRKMGQSESTEYCLGLPHLPDPVVDEILLNVPAQEIICVCRLVCREWMSMVDSVSFWKERCRREGFKTRVGDKSPKDWQLFYVLSKKRHNLLINPNAEEDFNGWELTENGGDQWAVEGMFEPHPDTTITKCFVTSYLICIKSQLIDLKKEGYNHALLDDIQPDIIISDWYAPRWDCGSIYESHVDLLDENMKTVKTFEAPPVTFPQWNDQQWNQMTHVFKNYGTGVRFIRFTHGGRDTKFWAGWYGIRVTNSSVEVYPAEEV